MNTCVPINQQFCIIECCTCIVHLFHILVLFDELDLSLQKAPAELAYIQVQRQLSKNSTNSLCQTRITAYSGKPGVTIKVLWEFEIYLSIVPIYWKLGLLHSLVSLLDTEISDFSLLQWIISLYIHNFGSSNSGVPFLKFTPWWGWVQEYLPSNVNQVYPAPHWFLNIILYFQ